MTCSYALYQHLDASVLGTCDNFEEKGLGDERYNFFTGCPKAKTATIILRYQALSIHTYIDSLYGL